MHGSRAILYRGAVGVHVLSVLVYGLEVPVDERLV